MTAYIPVYEAPTRRPRRHKTWAKCVVALGTLCYLGLMIPNILAFKHTHVPNDHTRTWDAIKQWKACTMIHTYFVFMAVSIGLNLGSNTLAIFTRNSCGTQVFFFLNVILSLCLVAASVQAIAKIPNDCYDVFKPYRPLAIVNLVCMIAYNCIVLPIGLTLAFPNDGELERAAAESSFVFHF